MSVYWDSSSLIAALVAGHPPDGVTRSHTLAEVFSTLTGKGIETSGGRQRLAPQDAAEILSDIPGLKFVELTAKETLKAINTAEALGIRGGLIHDWLHVKAAQKAGVMLIVTENTRHFQSLTAIPLQDFARYTAK